VEYLKELAGRADLGSWDAWSTQQRVLAAVIGLLLAYGVLRLVVPTLLRILRPALVVALGLLALWAIFPAETCSIEFLATLPVLCAR